MARVAAGALPIHCWCWGAVLNCSRRSSHSRFLEWTHTSRGGASETFRMKLSVLFDWIFDKEISAWWRGMWNFAPYQHYWLCWLSQWFYWPWIRRLRTNRVSFFFCLFNYYFKVKRFGSFSRIVCFISKGYQFFKMQKFKKNPFKLSRKNY